MAPVRFLIGAALIALLGLGLLAPATAVAAPPATAVTFPVTGTGTTAGGVPVTFAGTFTVTRFTTQGGQLLAVGTLTGTVTDALGNVLGTVTNLPVRLPVFDATATCEILDLELGPLDLDLLGLVVHLDRINLEITAEQGPGNLLGNLLCAVANLLNDGNPLTDIAGLLNNILRLLG